MMTIQFVVSHSKQCLVKFAVSPPRRWGFALSSCCLTSLSLQALSLCPASDTCGYCCQAYTHSLWKLPFLLSTALCLLQQACEVRILFLFVCCNRCVRSASCFSLYLLQQACEVRFLLVFVCCNRRVRSTSCLSLSVATGVWGPFSCFVFTVATNVWGPLPVSLRLLQQACEIRFLFLSLFPALHNVMSPLLTLWRLQNYHTFCPAFCPVFGPVFCPAFCPADCINTQVEPHATEDANPGDQKKGTSTIKPPDCNVGAQARHSAAVDKLYVSSEESLDVEERMQKGGCTSSLDECRAHATISLEQLAGTTVKGDISWSPPRNNYAQDDCKADPNSFKTTTMTLI